MLAEVVSLQRSNGTGLFSGGRRHVVSPLNFHGNVKFQNEVLFQIHFTVHYFIKYLFVGILLIGAATYCTNPAGPSPRLDQIANAYCECATEIVNLDQKARSMPDSTAEFTALLAQMQASFDEAGNCLRPVLAENSGLKPAEIPEFQTLLQKKCPTLAGNKELITELLCK